MRVQELGAQITDVPGIEFIRSEPSEYSDRGVHVSIKFLQLEDPISYGIKEFEELVTALTLARDRVQWLADNQGES